MNYSFQMENEGQLQCCPLVNINNSAIVCANMIFYFQMGTKGQFQHCTLVHMNNKAVVYIKINFYCNFTWRLRDNISIVHWYI